MKPKNAAAPGKRAAPRAERYFTVESANRALGLVSRIVRDVVAQYERLTRLRAEREELALSAGGDRLEDMRREIEAAKDRLTELRGELSDVGCELKDWVVGLVDFPALHQGRKVWLCWKLGDPQVAHWHELYAGFAGRKPIPADFGAEPEPARPQPGLAARPPG